MFEREYLNGKRNGQGKEYDGEYNLVFEGEYLNGKRWKGKGKEYNDYGMIIFKSEYSHGIILDKDGNTVSYKIDKLKNKNGFMKEYDENNNLIFEGEFVNNERLKGREYGRN